MNTPTKQPESVPIFSVQRTGAWVRSRPSRRKRRTPCKSYQVTNDEQRACFIQRIVGSQLTIREVLFPSTHRQAAEASNIRYSTAKTILKVYKIEGRVMKKKKRTKRFVCKTEMSARAEQESAAAAGHVGSTLKPGKLSSLLPANFWADHITAHLLRLDEAATSPISFSSCSPS